MEQILDQLKEIRVKLVTLQSSTNESLKDIDALIYKVITTNAQGNDGGNNFSAFKRFPKGITTKREKLLHIIREANRPISAKEVKQIVNEYGEELTHVDQMLVNLGKAKKLQHIDEDDRKKYFIKK